ncbi:trypco2 family protein [Kitasatospora sp. NPDC004240]
MIELAEMIAALRGELNAAIAGGDGQAVRFELGTIEIEATVAVEKAAGANGKVRFWVAEAGADGKLTHTRTQKITLTLQPALVSGGAPAPGGVRVPVMISGAEVDRER